MYIFALQGMKPHHEDIWNFVNFQSSTYSAVMMEFTTPLSYSSTVVNVGAIVADGQLIYTGVDNVAEHIEKQEDPEARWHEPTMIGYWWKSISPTSEGIETSLIGAPGKRQDRIDIIMRLKCLDSSKEPLIHPQALDNMNTSLPQT
ncbi:uncharacterized protein A1O9_08543 [Exophiala aquamarina CBS 119918]|uniref:Svf1-like C-terminal domain-containing protein n=1 Tax=Exophiala aquamarina CBS 119918 TaxID=1182545 RepID=A0A072P7W6_9EURO|nr:uncharacterized protein A1O9_08543 [Exophiala aquamarina CBS 119918]KEF55792.1 hypothetical protein A1O9_08543 [Exophiala aquamarina CBS 119918]